MTTLRMISGITYTRKNLEALTGMPDRENRRMIREQRRQGVPIVAMKDGGYKLAETEEEKQALLSMYRKRALDELGTYRRLARAMQVDGQMEMGGGNGIGLTLRLTKEAAEITAGFGFRGQGDYQLREAGRVVHRVGRPVLCVIFRRKGQYGAFISGCKVSIVVPHTSVAAESCVCQHRP